MEPKTYKVSDTAVAYTGTHLLINGDQVQVMQGESVVAVIRLMFGQVIYEQDAAVAL